ncbi:7044_t:CDS:2, partial [Paraglomus occultum]
WNTLSPNKQNKVFSALAPNFVVEIRSMSDSESFFYEKMRAWIEAGVEGLLLDSITQNARRYSKRFYHVHWQDLGNPLCVHSQILNEFVLDLQ